MNLKTNPLTGLVDSTALERFANGLPRGPLDCPTFGHLHRLRRTYKAMAASLRDVEREAWKKYYWMRTRQ